MTPTDPTEAPPSPYPDEVDLTEPAEAPPSPYPDEVDLTEPADVAPSPYPDDSPVTAPPDTAADTVSAEPDPERPEPERVAASPQVSRRRRRGPRTISEMFEAERSDTVTVRGRIVRSVVRLPVHTGDVIVVERRDAGAPRAQALKLAVADGLLGMGGVQAPALALWTHTSPDRVEINVIDDGAQTLEVWNGWLLGDVDASWMGNAGIVVRTDHDGHLLRCSDGVGPPRFTDLIVHLSIH